ncbi:ketopantoate reductase family protein [Pontibacillus salipaludis]|uniref:2-dehydropantoate 2-reductase n=1 Tax=Pontibacillus salipaludis TaxID=1697394 RepID=A0ABQ1Q8I8_9BACI|nr:2-dehydropantoate 2-reductase [Pontibacillus salipaludis]GGD19120.1 putative 2-dehydropantoate 2-reductase [Pontibacillus salipaludis]
MRVAVVGAGAIGLLYAIRTQEAGHEVTLYVKRGQQMDLIHNKGIQLDDRSKVYDIHMKNSMDLDDSFDLIIVATKQTHVKEVIEIVKKNDISTPLLFLQNGMGHIDCLDEMANSTAVGIVEHGARKLSDRTVAHTGVGVTRIAGITMKQEDLITYKEELDSSHFPYKVENDWFEVMSDKLIINAVINPLTSVFKVANGEVVSNPNLYRIAKRLCEEACNVLGKVDVEYHLSRVKKVALQTRENHSSMLEDIKNGRNTEIEGISGYLLKKASYELPYTTFVYEGVKAMQQMNRRGCE